MGIFTKSLYFVPYSDCTLSKTLLVHLELMNAVGCLPVPQHISEVHEVLVGQLAAAVSFYSTPKCQVSSYL
jgi:hypothetical protein